MKKAVLYVFSGTGNTKEAAGCFAAALEQRGYQVALWPVEYPYGDFPNPSVFGLVGFGYPIHAFNTPKLLVRFARLLPEVEGTPVFFFKTSGEPFALNSASSILLYNVLVKKGYAPMREIHLLMPYNIMFRYSDSLAKQMVLYTRAMIPCEVESIVAGEKQTFVFLPRHRLLSFLFRIQWPGASWNGRLYHANQKCCVRCTTCVKNCPAHNIRLKDNRVRFGGRCLMCMRCVMNCPKDAVRPGILNLWRVNRPYDFEALIKDESIPAQYVRESTKGYYALFYKYYQNADKLLEAHHQLIFKEK